MPGLTTDALAFVQQRGTIRPRDLKAAGLKPSSLRSLMRKGQVVRGGRGVYICMEFDFTEHHSLVEAIRVQSKAVVCLHSALSFHGLGTQLPHQVWLAVPYGTRISTNQIVSRRTVVLRKALFEAGIEHHQIEGTDVPIYNIAKTVTDCFKFRNKLGLDVALEALHDALRDRRCSREDIWRYSKINRVQNIIRPYLEALAI